MYSPVTRAEESPARTSGSGSIVPGVRASVRWRRGAFYGLALVAGSWLVVLGACTRPPAKGAGDAGAGSAAPSAQADVADAASAVTVGDAAVDGDAGAILVDGGGEAECVHAQYQPAACMTPVGALADDDVKAWFSARGVALVKDRLPGNMLEYDPHCTAVELGPDAKPALVCTSDRFVLGPAGADGPIMYHRSLHVLGVRDRRPVELLRLPLAISEAGHWADETLFAARYTVDAPGGAVELIVGPEECASAREGVAAYHTQWIAQIVGEGILRSGGGAAAERAQVDARRAAIRSDQAHIAASCKATGRYVMTSGGTLRRAQTDGG